MGNCLVTKLKGIVNDESLPVFGEFVIPTIKAEGTIDSQRVRLDIITDGTVTIKTDGVGYFAKSFEDLNDPSKRMTELQPVATQSALSLFFSNETYNIHITNMYTGVRQIGITPGGSSHRSIMNTEGFDFARLKYMQNIKFIGLNWCNLISGDTYDLKDMNLQLFSGAGCSLIRTSMADFANMTQLTECLLGTSNIKETTNVEDFVSAQVSKGRTNASIDLFYVHECFKIGGQEIPYAGGAFGCVEWIDSGASIFLGQGNRGVNNCSIIYVVGSTNPNAQARIAAWESAGKTVNIIS